MSFNKVKGYNDLAKESSTGQVINTNTQAYNNARIRAGKARLQEQRLSKLEKDINEIKQLLQDLANGNS